MSLQVQQLHLQPFVIVLFDIFFDTGIEFVSKISIGSWQTSSPFHDITGVSGGLYGHFRALQKALRTKTR